MKLNGVRASARQEGHVHVDRDISIREGCIKGTLQVETVIRDGACAVSRGGQRQGLGLEVEDQVGMPELCVLGLEVVE